MSLDKNERSDATFGYSLALEWALTALYGAKGGRKTGRWQGSAGSFQDAGNVRKAIKAACERIRKTLNDSTTADERFLHITGATLNAIEADAKRLGKEGAAAVDCIGHLIKLVAHLVGYDPRSSGKITRHVIYFQTIEQKLADDRDVSYTSQVAAHEHVMKVICRLYKEGDGVPLIARVMNRSELFVKDVLIHNGHLERQGTLRRRSTSGTNP